MHIHKREKTEEKNFKLLFLGKIKTKNIVSKFWCCKKVAILPMTRTVAGSSEKSEHSI